MPPSPGDFERLLRFFQQLYAHALTLQELVWSNNGLQYDETRLKYDRQADEQFQQLYQSLSDHQAFGRAVARFLNTHPKPENFQ